MNAGFTREPVTISTCSQLKLPTPLSLNSWDQSLPTAPPTGTSPTVPALTILAVAKRQTAAQTSISFFIIISLPTRNVAN